MDGVETGGGQWWWMAVEGHCKKEMEKDWRWMVVESIKRKKRKMMGCGVVEMVGL